jgi:hypothetical protein
MNEIFKPNVYGFLLICIGVTMLYIKQKHTKSDLMNFSIESHRARQLWRIMRYNISYHLKLHL